MGLALLRMTLSRKALRDAVYGRALPDDAPRSVRRAVDPGVVLAILISAGFVLIAMVWPVG